MYLIALFCICLCFTLSNASLAETLKKIDYDKTERPYSNTGRAARVIVQLFIHKIGPIDEADFEFSLGFYLRQWWRDPRLILANKPNSTVSDRLVGTSLDQLVWLPDTSVVDPMTIKKPVDSTRTEIYFTTGELYESKSLSSTTHCNMDLKKYPIDKQECDVMLESYAFSLADIDIVWHKTPVMQADENNLDGYKLVDISTHSIEATFQLGNSTQSFRRLVARVKVERNVHYHVYRSYIPSILLQAFAFGTFWVPDQAVPARVAMIVTTFLSNMLILQAITEKTVKVGYTTAMQIFLLVNITSIVLTLIEYLLVLQLKRNAEYRAKTMKDSTVVDKKQGDEAIVLNNIHSNGNELNNRKNGKDSPSTHYKNPVKILKKNSATHWVDKMSQVIFPVVYGIFLIVYFIYYCA